MVIYRVKIFLLKRHENSEKRIIRSSKADTAKLRAGWHERLFERLVTSPSVIKDDVN